MGSFSSTCVLSGLPIHAGDAVKCILVTANRFRDTRPCYPTDLWFPRTLAIDAFYNDYGSFENVTKESAQVLDAWLKGFDKDLAERGSGSNQYHDTPVTKGMSLVYLLDGMRAGRVKVHTKDSILTRRRVKAMNTFISEVKEAVAADPGVVKKIRERLLKKGSGETVTVDPSPELPPPVPATPPPPAPKEEHPRATTRKLISAILAKKLPEVPAFKEGREGYAPAQYTKGCVIIRWQGYSDSSQQMAKIVETLKAEGFPVVVAAGTGDYDHGKDVIYVLSRTGTLFGGDQKDPPQTVSFAMIRKDVWDAILQGKVEFNFKQTNFASFLKAAKTFAKDLQKNERKAQEFLARKDKSDPLHWFYAEDFWLRHDTKNPVHAYMTHELPFEAGLKTFVRTLAKDGRTLGDYEIRAMAEMAFICATVGTLRMFWHPAYSIGPQYSEWSDHVDFLKKALAIAEVQAAEQAKRY